MQTACIVTQFIIFTLFLIMYIPIALFCSVAYDALISKKV